MNFQDALTALQNGKRLTRACWKDKTKYVELFKRPHEKYQGYKQENTFYRQVAMSIGHYTHMDVCWTPMVSDILATDWEVVK